MFVVLFVMLVVMLFVVLGAPVHSHALANDARRRCQSDADDHGRGLDDGEAKRMQQHGALLSWLFESGPAALE
jgi:hypothetical protein